MKQLNPIFLRKITSVMAVSILLALFSCSDNKQFNKSLKITLENLSSVADTNATMAEIYFDTINLNGRKVSKENLYRYKLLSIKIVDKTSNIEPSKIMNTIDSILDFFMATKDDKMLPETFYYAGRVYAELSNHSKASELFNMAKKVTNHETENYFLSTAISDQLGYIYNLMNLKDESLKESIYAFKVALKSKYLPYIIRTECSLASQYIIMDSIQQAGLHMDRIMQYMNDQTDSQIRMSVLTQYAYLLLKQGKYHKADSILISIEDKLPEYQRPAFNFIRAYCYEKIGRTEKADEYYRLLLTSSKLRNKKQAVNYFLKKAVENKDMTILNDILKENENIYKMESAEKTEEISKLNKNVSYFADTTQFYKDEMKMLERQNYRLTIILYLLVFLISSLAIYKIIVWLKKRDFNHSGGLKDTEITLKPIENNAQIEVVKIKWLMEKIEKNNFTLNTDEWNNLELEIKERNENFYLDFKQLNLTKNEWRVSLLLKCGLKPSEIASIVNLSPSSITKMRKNLYMKIKRVDKCTPSDWDNMVLKY